MRLRKEESEDVNFEKEFKQVNEQEF